jgi:hypothetical protein
MTAASTAKAEEPETRSTAVGQTVDAEPWPSRKLLLRRVGILTAIGLGGAILLGSRVPVCPMVNLMGRPCPGCGLTRATFACLHGQFGEAARLHPLVFFATPIVVICGVLAAHSYIKRGKVRFSAPAARLLMPPLKVLYAALILLWIVRFFGVLGGPVVVDPSLFARMM